MGESPAVPTPRLPGWVLARVCGSRGHTSQPPQFSEGPWSQGRSGPDQTLEGEAEPRSPGNHTCLWLPRCPCQQCLGRRQSDWGLSPLRLPRALRGPEVSDWGPLSLELPAPPALPHPVPSYSARLPPAAPGSARASLSPWAQPPGACAQSSSAGWRGAAAGGWVQMGSEPWGSSGLCVETPAMGKGVGVRAEGGRWPAGWGSRVPLASRDSCPSSLAMFPVGGLFWLHPWGALLHS